MVSYEVILTESMSISKEVDNLISTSHKAVTTGMEADDNIFIRAWNAIVRFIKKVIQYIRIQIKKLIRFVKQMFNSDKREIKKLEDLSKKTAELKERIKKTDSDIEQKVAEEIKNIYDMRDNLKNMSLVPSDIINKVPSLNKYRTLTFLARYSKMVRPSMMQVIEIVGNLGAILSNILSVMRLHITTIKKYSDTELGSIVKDLCKAKTDSELIVAYNRTVDILYEFLNEFRHHIGNLAVYQSTVADNTRLIIGAIEALKDQGLLEKDRDYTPVAIGDDTITFLILKNVKDIGEFTDEIDAVAEYIANNYQSVGDSRIKINNMLNTILSKTNNVLSKLSYELVTVKVPVTDEEVVNYIKQFTDDVIRELDLRSSLIVKKVDLILTLREELVKLTDDVESINLKKIEETINNCYIDGLVIDKNVALQLGNFVKNLTMIISSTVYVLDKFTVNSVLRNNPMFTVIYDIMDVIHEILLVLAVDA